MASEWHSRVVPSPKSLPSTLIHPLITLRRNSLFIKEFFSFANNQIYKRKMARYGEIPISRAIQRAYIGLQLLGKSLIGLQLRSRRKIFHFIARKKHTIQDQFVCFSVYLSYCLKTILVRTIAQTMYYLEIIMKND